MLQSPLDFFWIGGCGYMWWIWVPSFYPLDHLDLMMIIVSLGLELICDIWLWLCDGHWSILINSGDSFLRCVVGSGVLCMDDKIGWLALVCLAWWVGVAILRCIDFIVSQHKMNWRVLTLWSCENAWSLCHTYYVLKVELCCDAVKTYGVTSSNLSLCRKG